MCLAACQQVYLVHQDYRLLEVLALDGLQTLPILDIDLGMSQFDATFELLSTPDGELKVGAGSRGQGGCTWKQQAGCTCCGWSVRQQLPPVHTCCTRGDTHWQPAPIAASFDGSSKVLLP